MARRLQALAALGWTRSDLAWRLDLSRAQLRRLFAGGGAPDLLPRVAEMADHLAAGSPPAETLDARGARGDALYRGWLPPAAWQGRLIDDPHAAPVSDRVPADVRSPAKAQPPPPRRTRTWHRAGDLVDDLEWLLETGETLHGACRRLVMSSAGLYAALRRAQRLDLWARLTSWDEAA